MKSQIGAFFARTLAWGSGAVGRDTAMNPRRQNTDEVAPDEKVPRDLPIQATLLANSGLNKPVWALLRVQDVIR